MSPTSKMGVNRMGVVFTRTGQDWVFFFYYAPRRDWDGGENSLLCHPITHTHTHVSYDPVPQVVQAQVVGQLAHCHGVGKVLLVGKHQDDGVFQLVLVDLGTQGQPRSRDWRGVRPRVPGPPTILESSWVDSVTRSLSLLSTTKIRPWNTAEVRGQWCPSRAEAPHLSPPPVCSGSSVSTGGGSCPGRRRPRL